MPPDHVELRHGAYHDSVAVMAAAEAAGRVDGVRDVLVAMATGQNLAQLRGLGFAAPPGAGPGDLVIALRAADDRIVAAARAAVDQALRPRAATAQGLGSPQPPRTVGAAAGGSGFEVALISVPGAHAFVEAMDALAAGLSVMVFSDHVPVADEIALKAEAARRGLLAMGPDCGTAVIGGVGLGFANVVRPGPVGIVGASGTGIQQVCCLLDHAGVGVSHALGVGGRDLSAEVGGAATLPALDLLAADPATEVIVLVSKPPAPQVAARVAAAAAACPKPVVLAFVGPGSPDLTARTAEALRLLGIDPPDPGWWLAPRRRDGRYRRLVGLFAGGTLSHEAAAIVGDGHEIVDLGDDAFTAGRPHPMIDQRTRLDRLAVAAEGGGVLLLDVVLGHGAHPDPAAELAPAVAAALAERRGDVAAVVSLCGTAGDPQGLERQAARLVDAGASVHLSNADAARKAMELLDRV